MGDINSASADLRARLDKEGDQRQIGLDLLYDTVKDLKASREKAEKQNFEYQKEAMMLKTHARNAGFDIDYDPQSNSIRPIALPPPEPSRLKAYRTPDGGMTTEETVGTPPRPGQEAQKPMTDPGTDSVIAGFKAEQILKAKQKINGTGAAGANKPLTESQRTSITMGSKIERLVADLQKQIKGGGNRALSTGPKFITTMGKSVPGMKNIMDKSERIRDIYDQLKASIPFAKGGKALSEREYTVLSRLLEHGVATSDETVNYHLNEFIKEYKQLGKLALESKADLTDEDVSGLASDDISAMSKQKDGESSDARLQRILEDEGLE